MQFVDRVDAGKKLAAQLLRAYKGQRDTLVLGLARGGVVVAHEVAALLGLPLHVIVVRKIGAPGNEELALGAISTSGEGIFNERLIGLLGATQEYLKATVEREKGIAQKRLALYQGSAPPPQIKDKTVLLVDDGIATGASMKVAIQAVRSQGAKKIVLAVPVAASDSLRQIEPKVDEVVCLSVPPFFEAVGAFYRVFDQTTDEEIIDLLSHHKSP